MRFEVRNGNFGYGASQVLHQVSFDLEGNQVLAVLGPNGVGKTTLLKCMMGLLKWDSGESRIDGVPMNTLKHSEIWKRNGKDFQTISYTGSWYSNGARSYKNTLYGDTARQTMMCRKS